MLPLSPSTSSSSDYAFVLIFLIRSLITIDSCVRQICIREFDLIETADDVNSDSCCELADQSILSEAPQAGANDFGAFD